MKQLLVRRALARRPSAAARNLAFTLLACWAPIASARAHDFWIVPSSFTPEVNARISIELRVGERWKGEEVTRNPERIERFFAVHADAREESVPGIDGKSPAGFVRSTQRELLWLGYESRPTSIELLAEKFESYLVAEGLDHVVASRKQRGESQRKGREIYSRSVKSLLCVGAPKLTETPTPSMPPSNEATSSAAGTGFDRRLGLPLEIFVEHDPYALRPGDELSVRIEFQGKPLADALVGCVSQDDPEHEARARTQGDGRVQFKLDRSGGWLVRVVHMLPAERESGADWRSYWASLTFALPAARASDAR